MHCNFLALVITGNEQPHQIQSSANISCSSDLEVQTIRWLNSSDNGRELFSATRQQQLFLPIEGITSSLANTMYTCEVRVTVVTHPIRQTITFRVNSKFLYTPFNRAEKVNLSCTTALYICSCIITSSTTNCVSNLYHIIQCHCSMDVDRSLQLFMARNLRLVLWCHIRTAQHKNSWGNCQPNKSDILHKTHLTTARHSVLLQSRVQE
jgi:hypothetical protein